jgi:hypothetical protein
LNITPKGTYAIPFSSSISALVKPLYAVPQRGFLNYFVLYFARDFFIYDLGDSKILFFVHTIQKLQKVIEEN